MFIDFLTVLLLNMAAAYLMLAWFMAVGLAEPSRKRWAPGFGITGLVAAVNGLRITWTWPLPGSYNALFGEMSVLFGAALLGLAWALACDYDLVPVAIFGTVAGVAAVFAGLRIAAMGLTAAPKLSGLGFVLSGLAGAFALPAVVLRGNKAVRSLVVVLSAASAVLWGLMWFKAFAMHLTAFAKWLPETMK